jgi:hypothetical protein
MKHSSITVSLIFFCFFSRAQISQIDNDGMFAFQVKQIDEFIERFNFEKTHQTFLNEYLKSHNISDSSYFNREIFIKTLLNQDTSLNISLANEFISFVDSAEFPIHISFYDDDWYALLDCDFMFLGERKKITLMLINQTKINQTSKWVIYSVKSDLFIQPQQEDSTKIMNPMSHAVNFMSLEKCIYDKANSANYYKKNFRPDAMSEFYFLIQNNLLTFNRINSIKYIFLQIPNWYLKVEYFSRQTNNSGWLISQLKKMNYEEKKLFRKEYLNVN